MQFALYMMRFHQLSGDALTCTFLVTTPLLMGAGFPGDYRARAYDLMREEARKDCLVALSENWTLDHGRFVCLTDEDVWIEF